MRCLLADVSKRSALRHPCPCDAPSPILVKSLAWTYDASADVDVQDMSYGVSLEQPPSLPSDALRLDTILEMHAPSLRLLMCMDTDGGASSESEMFVDTSQESLITWLLVTAYRCIPMHHCSINKGALRGPCSLRIIPCLRPNIWRQQQDRSLHSAERRLRTSHSGYASSNSSASPGHWMTTRPEFFFFAR